jgi:UDP-N-acetylmuramate--alanine ligase
VQVCASLDELAEQVARSSRDGDLVLAMGAGDVNGLWQRLEQLQPLTALDGSGGAPALAA